MIDTQQQPSLPAFKIAVEELHDIGVTLTMLPGEYKVNYRNGAPSTAYYSDDLAEALAHGRNMAHNLPVVAPLPLGPMARRSRRGKMYKHNAKVAAKRRREINT